MKTPSLLLVSILFLQVLLFETASADDLNTSTPSLDKIYTSGSQTKRWCGTGFMDLYRGTGDMSANPLKLTFMGESAPPNASAAYQKWQNQLNSSIDQKFATLSPVDAQGKLVVVGCRYKISKHRKFEEFILFGEGSKLFDAKLRQAILSLDGSDILKLPDIESDYIRGSGRFVQNYGPEYISSEKEVGSKSN